MGWGQDRVEDGLQLKRLKRSKKEHPAPPLKSPQPGGWLSLAVPLCVGQKVAAQAVECPFLGHLVHFFSRGEGSLEQVLG